MLNLGVKSIRIDGALATDNLIPMDRKKNRRARGARLSAQLLHRVGDPPADHPDYGAIELVYECLNRLP